MGFQIFASRYIDRLSNQFISDLITEYPESDPFDPIYVVTQTEGMSIWLSTRVSESTGISANIRFLTLQSLVEKIHDTLFDTFSDKISKKSIVWDIYQLLGETEFKERASHKSVVSYIEDDQLKRLGLAQKLVDLFDQYQIYRPALIESWNLPNDEEVDFQEFLWRKLKSKMGDEFRDKTIIRSRLLQTIEKLFQEGSTESLRAFDRIYFFGLSIVAPYHMNIIETLAKISMIRFYMLNPAASDHWFEDFPEDLIERWRKLRPGINPIPANSLLTSWGKIIKDSFRMFMERTDLVTNYVSLDDKDRALYTMGDCPEPISKLQLLQRQIMFNHIGKETVYVAKLTADDSIQIHACYTHAREVEALYNYLISLFEKDKTLTGRDILVSCDIDIYAPFIRAVFDTGPVKFRYTISDAAYTQGDNPIRAIDSILSLEESDFNAEEVLRLLDFTCIRNKFGITDVSLIRDIIRDAMFRFGLEGREEDDSKIFSLTYAIKRIVYGLSMRIDGMYEDFFPLDLVEGQESDQALRFCIFAETLKDTIHRRKGDKKLDEWVEYAEGVMADFLFESETEDEDQIKFQAFLNRELGHFNLASGRVEEKVPYRIFSTALKEAVNQERRMKRFHSQGITFCSHVPMRSISFRVVCMLGMDNDKFPRQNPAMSFSYIDGNQIGDRSMRNEDKHLFLESLMSAGSHFYLSYLGTHVKENSHIPPSVLVEELINYLTDRSESPDSMRSALVIRHPLHSFSHRYNKEGSIMISYLIDGRKQEIPLKKDHVQQMPIKTVNLRDFSSFYSDPFKFYYNKGLKVYYEEVDELLPISEMFDMNDTLDRFLLKVDIITGKLNEQNIREAVLSGDLPPGNVGKVIYDLELGKVFPFKDEYEQLISGIEETNDRNISISVGDELKLEGKLKGLYNNKLIYVNPSESNLLKKLIPFSIKYLAMRAAGMEVEGYFLAKVEKRNDCRIFKMNPLSTEDALSKIKVLMSFFIHYSDRIMPFHPILLEGIEVIPPKLHDETVVKEFREKMLGKIEAEFEDKDSYIGKEHLSMKYIKDAYERGLFEKEGFIDELIENSISIFNELIPSVFDLTDL
jgi:exodeoxyribonuclease V gamma subunit